MCLRAPIKRETVPYDWYSKKRFFKAFFSYSSDKTFRSPYSYTNTGIYLDIAVFHPPNSNILERYFVLGSSIRGSGFIRWIKADGNELDFYPEGIHSAEGSYIIGFAAGYLTNWHVPTRDHCLLMKLLPSADYFYDGEQASGLRWLIDEVFTAQTKYNKGLCIKFKPRYLVLVKYLDRLFTSDYWIVAKTKREIVKELVGLKTFAHQSLHLSRYAEPLLQIADLKKTYLDTIPPSRIKSFIKRYK